MSKKKTDSNQTNQQVLKLHQKEAESLEP